MTLVIPEEVVISKIYFIRGQKVIIDSDLADLYQVETKHLKRQVRRNAERFPIDFMFELTEPEFKNLQSHFGTSSWGGTRVLPMAFTEYGVLMLSSVLNNKKAIQINIQIMRIFTRIRKMLADNADLRAEVEQIKKKLTSHGQNIELVFKYIDELLSKDDTLPARRQIGFKIPPKK